MTLLIGIIIGFYFHKVFAWIDKKVVQSIKEETNEPHEFRPYGKQISFEEWMKLNDK